MLPLAHRRILITRARNQASALAEALVTRGAETILIPTIEIAPPASYCALDAALASIRSFDWLLFTSANAVAAYMERARQLRLLPQARRVAVIGPATARAVVASGLAGAVDLVPAQAVAESFAATLKPHADGASMLLVQAAVTRNLLPEALTAAGATVTVAEAYRNVIPSDSVASLRQLFPTAPPDAITFTSASTAQNLASLLEAAGLPLPAGIVLASIGPITSTAMRNLQMEPSVEAADATIDALVEALVTYWS